MSKSIEVKYYLNNKQIGKAKITKEELNSTSILEGFITIDKKLNYKSVKELRTIIVKYEDKEDEITCNFDAVYNLQSDLMQVIETVEG